jgi:hypothetical protein
MKNINFGLLVRLEPKLLDLLVEAAAVSRETHTPRELDKLWYSSFKERMYKLVGLGVGQKGDIIHSSEAYDCAYSNICGCLTGEYIHGCTDWS